MTVTLHEGDSRVVLTRLIDQGIRVHSVVTDPPYGLVSIQKRFGKENSAPARTENNDGSFARLSGGFMGKKWDATGIERDPEFWALIYEILLPGGYVFAFSGSRTGHWQACAMELAGFIMHPMHGWVFGSGFPKAHAADKAIDKLLGVKGEFMPEGNAVKRMIPGADQHATGSWEKNNGREYQPGRYVPGSPEAAEWEGWAYGTQAQKPALEPIYLAQKPFSEKTGAANLLMHGVGAVNIDGCRVDAGGLFQAEEIVLRRMGRHPANLILDGSPEVVAMFPDGKSGVGAVKRVSSANQKGNTGFVYGAESRSEGTPMISYGDEGSAARFFHQFPRYACNTCHDTGMVYTPMQYIGDSPTHEPCQCGGPLDPGNPLIYNGKAGKLDRAGSKHPTVKPISLLQYLARHITPPGGILLDPFAGSGTTAEAARREGFDCILIEAEPEYTAFIRQRFKLPHPRAYLFEDLLGDSSPFMSIKCRHGTEDLLG